MTNGSTPPEALVAMAWKLLKKCEYSAAFAFRVDTPPGRYCPTNEVNCPICAKNTGTKRYTRKPTQASTRK